MVTSPMKPDETIPGGKYLNATQDRWEDANGKDLGPVVCSPDCGCDDGECAADTTITVHDDGTFEADPPELVESVEVVDESGTVIGEATPKRTRSRKAAA